MPRVSRLVGTPDLDRITPELAEFGATEWCGDNDSIVKQQLISAILDREQHRGIGKVLAPASEMVVRDWLVDQTGLEMGIIHGKPYDIETMHGTRIQVKFRYNQWDLETTRRHSKKNQDTNASGHVVYREDEFDVLAVFIPGPGFGRTGSRIRLVPVDELVNPNKPDELVTKVRANIRRKYDDDEMTRKVIRRLFHRTPSSPLSLCL